VNVCVCVLCGYVPVNLVMPGSVSRSGCCVFVRVRMFGYDSEYMCESRSGFVSASLSVYMFGCVFELVTVPLYASVSMFI
jgi:hypothetical protein